MAVITDGEFVLVEEHLTEAIPLARGAWGPTADVVPIIKARQERIPYITAWADHGGADITAVTPTGKTLDITTGDGEPMRKVAPGGQSQQRFQQRADNEWAENATEAAERITKLAKRVDARTVIVGGETRSINMIAEQLPRDFPVALIEYGRATDGSEEMRDDEVRRLVHTAVAEDTVAILEKWKEERGQRDHATEGILDTAEALQRAAVDVLLVPDDRDLPADDAGVVDTLVRDAILTGASARVVPSAGPIPGGVGAILRFV
jgi:stalled ribosome rescue protein Dom34